MAYKDGADRLNQQARYWPTTKAYKALGLDAPGDAPDPDAETVIDVETFRNAFYCQAKHPRFLHPDGGDIRCQQMPNHTDPHRAVIVWSDGGRYAEQTVTVTWG